MYVTSHKLNNASFRQTLDPITKNIFRRQHPLEFVFKDISTFDVQNSIIGSLLKEVDLAKKDTTISIIKKAPNVKEVEIKSCLQALRNRNNNNDENNLPPPTFSPYQPPPPAPLSLPPSPLSFLHRLLNHRQISNHLHHLQHFFNLHKIIQNNR